MIGTAPALGGFDFDGDGKMSAFEQAVEFKFLHDVVMADRAEDKIDEARPVFRLRVKHLLVQSLGAVNLATGILAERFVAAHSEKVKSLAEDFQDGLADKHVVPRRIEHFESLGICGVD